jgi:hypothetical protein
MKTWLCLQSGKKTTLQSENSHLKLEPLQQKHEDKLRSDEKKRITNENVKTKSPSLGVLHLSSRNTTSTRAVWHMAES